MQSDDYVDVDAPSVEHSDVSPFVWLPSITMSSIGIDRGAGRRLSRICPVAQIWGVARQIRESEPDQRYSGRVWLAISGQFEAATFDPETGGVRATYASADLYLPTSFHAAMIDVIRKAAGSPVEFRLDVAVRPAGHDGAYMARVKILGDQVDPMPALRDKLGVKLPELQGAPKLTPPTASK